MSLDDGDGTAQLGERHREHVDEEGKTYFWNNKSGKIQHTRQYDLCGSGGCILQDRHPGLCQISFGAEPSGRLDSAELRAFLQGSTTLDVARPNPNAGQAREWLSPKMWADLSALPELPWHRLARSGSPRAPRARPGLPRAPQPARPRVPRGPRP